MIKIHDMFISIRSGSPAIADLISAFSFEEIVEDTTNEQLENESTT